MKNVYDKLIASDSLDETSFAAVYAGYADANTLNSVDSQGASTFSGNADDAALDLASFRPANWLTFVTAESRGVVTAENYGRTSTGYSASDPSLVGSGQLNSIANSKALWSLLTDANTGSAFFKR